MSGDKRVNVNFSNFKSICRFCLNKFSFPNVCVFSEENRTQAIFASNNINRDESVTEMVKYCTGMDIYSHDSLPPSMCTQCFEKLLQCNKFRRECLRSEEILKEALLKHLNGLEVVADAYDIIANYGEKSEIEIEDEINLGDDELVMTRSSTSLSIEPCQSSEMEESNLDDGFDNFESAIDNIYIGKTEVEDNLVLEVDEDRTKTEPTVETTYSSSSYMEMEITRKNENDIKLENEPEAESSQSVEHFESSSEEWHPPFKNVPSTESDGGIDYRARRSEDGSHGEQQQDGYQQNQQNNRGRGRGPGGKYSRPSRETKELLISCYEDGMTISEAARRTKINKNTAKSIIRSYKKDGELSNDRRGGKKPRKLTEELLSAIENYVERIPGITAKNIQKNLQREKDIAVSLSTIRNGLRELKITLKLASVENEQLNSPLTIQLRKIYAEEFTVWASENRNKMIFIDECGFSLYLRKTQARSRRGTGDRVIVPLVHGRNVTLIAAVNNQRILHYKILAKSTCDSDRFNIFLVELIEKLQETPSLMDAFLIMDNASIHKTQQVRDTLSATNLTLKFLPPYSPMLNPIEKSFSKIKAHTRQVLGDISREHNLIAVIENSLQQITMTDCANFVMDMILLIPKAAGGQSIY